MPTVTKEHTPIAGRRAQKRDTSPFRLDADFLDRYRDHHPNLGFGGLGEFVFYRTYSRLRDDGTKESFLDTLQRVVEGCYEIQRRHCSQMNIPWTRAKAQRSAHEMFQRMWDMKFLPPGRGLWGMGTPFMWERGSACLLNCFAYDTEVITRGGIKKIGALAGTEQTLLTTGGAWVNATVGTFGKQRLWKITLSRDSARHVIYATENHRWLAKDRRYSEPEEVLRENLQAAEIGGTRTRQRRRNNHYTSILTRDLRPRQRLQYVFGHGIKDSRPSPFGIAHGFCYGDGVRGSCALGNSTSMYLIGKKDAAMLRYFAMCPSEPAVGLEAKLGQAVTRVADLPKFFKQLPSLSESKSYLYGWLAGYFAADGTINPAGNSSSITSHRLSDILFVRDVCAVLGIGAYKVQRGWRKLRQQDGSYTRHRSYRITLMSAHLPPEFFLLDEHRSRFENWSNKLGRRTLKYWSVVSIEPTDRVEEVYCATVPKYHTFALAGNILTGNCAFYSTENIGRAPAEPFAYMMDMSMVGVGVGFDTRGAGKLRLSKPHNTTTTIQIDDSREGWVDSVRVLVESYTTHPELGRVSFDYSLIRKAGSIIKGFGGKASGPGALRELHEMLRNHFDRILDRLDPILSSTDIVDLMNYLGRCVVAGNVRRSAQIAFGEPDDLAYLKMKDKTLFPQELDSHRWASNNSVYAEVGMDYSGLAQQIATNGEPGLLWLDNMRNYGRMIDGRQPGIDGRVMGGNPCLEQSLESGEACNLVETFPSHHTDAADYHRTLKFAYLYAKTVTLQPTHNQETNAIALRNRRIGLSQSGIAEAFSKFGRRRVLAEFCDVGYKAICDWDKVYSDWLCIGRSIKKTSVKPSGTVSLVAGVTPGIHFSIAPSRSYWRSVRVSKSSLLEKLLRQAGYKVEQDIRDKHTSVVWFGVANTSVPTTGEVSMWEQVKNACDYQRYWADNQVSCTVHFSADDRGEIAKVLTAFDDQLKGISFLPQDHGFEQAPYEPATEDEVRAYQQALKPIRWDKYITEDADASATKFCDGEACQLGK